MGKVTRKRYTVDFRRDLTRDWSEPLRLDTLDQN
jgi:hypothetical protein